MRGLLPAPKAVGTVTAGETQAWGPGQVGGAAFHRLPGLMVGERCWLSPERVYKKEEEPAPFVRPWNQSASTKERLDVTLTLGFSSCSGGGPRWGLGSWPALGLSAAAAVGSMGPWMARVSGLTMWRGCLGQGAREEGWPSP